LNLVYGDAVAFVSALRQALVTQCSVADETALQRVLWLVATIAGTAAPRHGLILVQVDGCGCGRLSAFSVVVSGVDPILGRACRRVWIQLISWRGGFPDFHVAG
tara:strand:+ start:736 stop:1047 length:312 start_codon:yes stop_codon:yes gene_type:complete